MLNKRFQWCVRSSESSSNVKRKLGHSHNVAERCKRTSSNAIRIVPTVHSALPNVATTHPNYLHHQGLYVTKRRGNSAWCNGASDSEKAMGNGLHTVDAEWLEP